MHKVHRVAMDIMSCLAIGLGLPEDFYVKVGLMCPFICSQLTPIHTEDI